MSRILRSGTFYNVIASLVRDTRSLSHVMDATFTIINYVYHQALKHSLSQK
jgi:hypothetical protein